jgi:hypothetical protein
MLKQRNRVVLFLSIFVCTFFAAAQQAKLVPLTPAELDKVKEKLDSKLMPEDAKEPEVDSGQVFHLLDPDVPSFTVVPVHFDIPIGHETGGATKTDCGVFFIPDNGSAAFLWTIGKEAELKDVTDCEGVKAIGLQHTVNSNPALILLYGVHNSSGSFSQAYILSWNKDSKAYQVDEDWNMRIAGHVKVLNIRNIRQFMSQPK